MPQEKDVHETGHHEVEKCRCPDDQDVRHTRQDDRFLPAVLRKKANILPELDERGVIAMMLRGRIEILHEDCVEGGGVDDVARTFAKQDPNPSLKREVGEECHVLDAFFALGQFGEDKESSPPTAILSHPDALHSHRQRVEIALRNAAPLHNPHGSNPFGCQIGKG